MLRWLIEASLRFRLVVIALAAAVIALGITQLPKASVDVLPEFTPPYAEIQTEALGLSPEEVEQFITVPLEADLLNGVEGVDVIRSRSVPGLSSIVLVFEPGTDVFRARQLVEERLTQAHALPNVSKPPTLLQPLSSSSRLLMIGLSSDRLTPIERSVIARWTIKPRLMGVPGVANVAIWGMRDQQLQVQVDPERLRDTGVTLNQVIRSTGNAQVVSPLSFLEASTPGSGGFIETPRQRLQVRNVLDKIAEPAELGKVPIEDTGGRLRLTDVADVKIDHQPLIGDAVVGGGDGLLLVVEKFPGASTLAVTRGVEEALDKLRPGLSGMRTDTSIFRPASFIEDAIGDLRLALAIGGALMALVLAALLLRWRTVLICAVTIPLSLVAAALAVDAMGESFNAISVAGLAVALVIVVDEAIVGADNVARRVRAAREAGRGATTEDVVRDATHEVRSPLVYATIIVLLAIVPVAVMQGRPGAFFGPLALAYALGVAAAMVVALVVAPALSVLLYARGAPGDGEPRPVARIAGRYTPALAALLRRPRAVLFAAGACVLAGLVTLPLLATAPIPSFKDPDILVRLDGAPGTSHPRMKAVATDVSRRLRAVPGVGDTGAHVGRAVTGDRTVDVNSSEVWIRIDPGADYEATLASIDDVVRRVPAVHRDVVTYSTQKIRDVGALNSGANDVRGGGLDVLTGVDEPLVVRVYGQDPAALRREAERVRRVVAQVDGVVDPRVRLPDTEPSLEIEVDLARAQRLGIKPGDVRRAEATLLQGIQVGSVFQKQKVFDVIVQGVPATRRSVASVRDLLIDRPGGGHARLGDVADVRIAPAAVAIEREAVSRRLDVEAGVSGRSTAAVARDVEQRLERIDHPLEYHAEVVGTTTSREIAATRMLAFALACVIAAVLLLQAAFQSWRLAVLAFASLPIAIAGGLIAALVNGAELSLGALAGLLALFALAVRSGVLLIRHLQDLERDGQAFGAELVGRGARDRFGAVLTTVCALAALALPFAVLGAEPGLEIAHPMAVVLLGGLVTLTFLSMFVLPALYLRFGRGTGRAPAPDEGEELLRRWVGGEPAPEPAPGPAPAKAVDAGRGPAA